jgi:hypothetical protein
MSEPNVCFCFVFPIRRGPSLTHARPRRHRQTQLNTEQKKKEKVSRVRYGSDNLFGRRVMIQYCFPFAAHLAIKEKKRALNKDKGVGKGT